MPYRAAKCLCVRLGPNALRVASNLSQSARSGSPEVIHMPDKRAYRTSGLLVRPLSGYPTYLEFRTIGQDSASPIGRCILG
jgi:hypothetical protein